TIPEALFSGEVGQGTRLAPLPARRTGVPNLVPPERTISARNPARYGFDRRSHRQSPSARGEAAPGRCGMRTRRQFLKSSSVGLAAAGVSRADTPAILGGKPVFAQQWPAGYPVYDPAKVPQRLKDVLAGGKWTQITGDNVVRFDKAIAERFGVRCSFST